jgi:signal transduction histidine kinase
MFVFFPFLFLDLWKEKWAFGVTYGLNVAYVVGYDPLHKLLGIDMASLGLELDNYHVLTQNSITFLINISLGFIFLKLVNHRFEQRNERLNQMLKERNLAIQGRNEVLELQKKKIEAMKDDLERQVKARTEKLEARNRQLSDYAHWNAHKLRAPVATVLGLIALMELEDTPGDLAKHPYFPHLKITTVELDAIIREMQGKVNESDQDQD